MNPLFQQVVQNIVKKKLQKKRGRPIPAKVMADAMHVFRVELFHAVKEYGLIILGVVSAGFGLKGFLLPSHFIDGGVTGISLLVEIVTGIPLSILLVAINLPFIILGIRTIGPQFAFRSIIAIALLALAVHLIPYPIITEDKLLVAIFGGFFLGMGIGLSVRGGAVIDGTEVLAIYASRKSSLTIGDIILILNIIIFSFGAYILSIETALYAVLTYLAAAKTVDFIIDGIEEYIGVTIISERSEDIRIAITKNLGRGCTIYNGKRGYGKKGADMPPIDIIYTVITRLELAKLKTEIDKVDEKAFIVMGVIMNTKGGMVKKRPLH